jgi:hypothetical protein
VFAHVLAAMVWLGALVVLGAFAVRILLAMVGDSDAWDSGQGWLQLGLGHRVLR